MNCSISLLSQEEFPRLEEFLYEAIFIPPGVAPPPRSVVQLPELQVYVSGFGSQPDDWALAARAGGDIVGIVWVRIMDDYGHWDGRAPSLAIALKAPYRGQGIGTRLMEAMLSLLREKGYQQVSLSVQKANPAARLYRRLGFQSLRETEEEWIMVCPLPPQQ